MSYKETLIEFITNGLNNPDKTKAFGYDAIEILTEIEHNMPDDKTGEWIILDNDEYGKDVKCSNCSREYWMDHRSLMKMFNYCPNCGARMWEKEKNETISI